jgi:hypothetical protein
MAIDVKPRSYDPKRRSYGTIGRRHGGGPGTVLTGVADAITAGRCPNGDGDLRGGACVACGFRFEKVEAGVFVRQAKWRP